MILDYVFPGGSVFRIYDFLNDKIIDEIPYITSDKIKSSTAVYRMHRSKNINGI